MSTMIPADPGVANAIIQGLNITGTPALIEAREILGSMLRASLADTSLYGNPLDWTPQAGMTMADITKNLHPFNVAAALLSVVHAGPAFHTELQVQQELHVYLQAWVPLSQCSAQLVSILPPVAPAPPVFAAPPPPPAAVPPPHAGIPAPPALPTADVADLSSLAAALTGHPVDVAPAAPAPVHTATIHAIHPPVTGQALGTAFDQMQAEDPAVFANPGQEAAAYALAGKPMPEQPTQTTKLPTTAVAFDSAGKAGRPYKSSFEKEHTARKTISKPPFWWDEMVKRWHLLFTQSPCEAVGNESTGNAPLIAYTAMIHTMQLALYNVPPDVTVADLNAWLAAVRENIAQSPSAPVAFSLQQQLFAQT